MKKIRVGIDAKWYFDGNVSGRVVVRNLIQNFDQSDAVEWVYFFKEKHRNDPEILQLKGKVVFIWGGNNMLSNLFVLPFYAIRHQCDCILFQYFPSFLFWKRQYSFIHAIGFISNPEYFTLTERIYLFPLRFLMKLTAGIITVSEFEKSRMEKWGFGKNIPKHVVYHGISSDFKPKDLQPIGELTRTSSQYDLPERFILFVGRLNIIKNILNLLKAFRIVADKDPDIQLVVVGDKDWKSLDIDYHIKTLGLSDRVQLKGSVFGTDLPYIYSLATVFCFPSFNESFGLPPLEAMASGVPVVASDRSSLPEICLDAVLYADPDDYIMIASKLLTLITDQSLRNEFIERGLVRAKEFTWKKSVDTLIHIFNNPNSDQPNQTRNL
ncbi:MAG: glycosyltransferase family 4 protein [Bacteroidetes bacterium]|nr:glycosyltransferase family 4 protein [Bacteroidota bacterium]